jgi:segregation and condensation protein B
MNIPSLNNQEEKKGCLEGLLFAYGSPISLSHIAKTISASEAEAKTLLEELSKEYSDHTSRGLMIIEKNNSYLLTTKPSLTPFLEEVIKAELKEDLTPAALETLSLVTYFGPIARADIDYIRGVNSTYMLKTLLLRGLIERKSKGNYYVYEPSIQLLSFIGTSDMGALPEYETYRAMKEELFGTQETAEVSISDTMSQETNTKTT